MKLSRAFVSFALICLFVPLSRADWKPAAAPLMTKWGKQVSPENAWREYPRPQLVRNEWVNLNGLWDYAIVEKGSANPKPQGQILVPYPIESALSGVGKHITQHQNLWYFRQLDVPAGWTGKRVLLHFDAVDWETTVFANGKEVGAHRGGFDPFTFDITDELKAGRNELSVRVWDPTDAGAQPRGKQVSKPGGIWYTPVSGIWQTVWLEAVPETYITGVQVSTNIENGEGDVVVSVAGANKNARTTLKLPGSNKVLAGDAGKPIHFRMEKPELWTPDTPKLYSIEVGILKAGSESEFEDQAGSYFAFRKISTGKDENGLMRIMLNNKPVFQIGPLDQGWWPDGLLTPPSDEAMKYDLEVLKKLGMNMLRKHIKVEPARYYYHCDQLGLLVWQDMPSGAAEPRHFIAPNAIQDAEFAPGEKSQFRAELKAMIDCRRFFPSIIAWVPFNEGWGQRETNDILKWVKQYDSTRLVNGPSGWTDRGYGDMKDMHNYPGPGMFPVMPDRVSVLGEFGGLGLVLKGHLWKENNNWGYQTFKSTEELRDGYHQLMLRMRPLISKGLSAAVYTQTTDVEVEVNGLMTYDREVIKLDVADAARWHQALHGPLPEYRVVLATSEKTPQRWRHTTAKPAEGWQKSDFDASSWKESEGGFGTRGTPGAIVRTEWNTDDIWLRRSFDLKELPKGDVLLRLHHDEDVEVYINGVLALKAPGYVSDYGESHISAAAMKAMKLGGNTIAVHCHQTTGGQYIDLGLLELVEGKKR